MAAVHGSAPSAMPDEPGERSAKEYDSAVAALKNGNLDTEESTGTTVLCGSTAPALRFAELIQAEAPSLVVHQNG